MARNGGSWRGLPDRYGKWSTAWRRFRRWSLQGVFQGLLEGFSQEADTEWRMLDSTVVRVHQHAFGAKEGTCSHGLGRSAGGLSTKIQAVCDALGNPMRFLLTAGNRADCTQALILIKGTQVQSIIADRGYDADYILQAIHTTGTFPVISSKSNRCIQHSYDQHLYKHRNLIERLFLKLKNFPRIPTRYHQTAPSVLA